MHASIPIIYGHILHRTKVEIEELINIALDSYSTEAII